VKGSLLEVSLFSFEHLQRLQLYIQECCSFHSSTKHSRQQFPGDNGKCFVSVSFQPFQIILYKRRIATNSCKTASYGDFRKHRKVRRRKLTVVVATSTIKPAIATHRSFPTLWNVFVLLASITSQQHLVFCGKPTLPPVNYRGFMNAQIHLFI